MIQHKECDLVFKAEAGDGDFRAYFATWGGPDRVGDIIERGAFGNTGQFLKTGWIGWQHDMQAVPIGYPVSAVQDSFGLLVAGKFHGTPEAQRVRTLLVERKAAGKACPASIGYKVLDSAPDYVNGKRVTRLKSLDLFECSFVLCGANAEAGLLSVKADADPASTGRPAKTPEFWAWLHRIAGHGPHTAGDVEHLFSLWLADNSPDSNPYQAGIGQAWRSDVGPGVEGGNGMLSPGKSASVDQLRESLEAARRSLRGEPSTPARGGEIYSGNVTVKQLVEHMYVDPFTRAARWMREQDARRDLPRLKREADELRRKLEARIAWHEDLARRQPVPTAIDRAFALSNGVDINS